MSKQLIVGLVAVLALTGCGSKKSSTPPAQTSTSSSTSSTSTSSTATSSTSTSSSSSGSPGKLSFASASHCAQLASLASKVASSVSPTGDAATNLQNEEKVFDALAAAAPDEIKGDFKTFADAFKTFAAAYGGVGLKAGQVPSAQQLLKLQSAAKALSTPKLKTAEAHLSAWAQKNCGLSSTSP